MFPMSTNLFWFVAIVIVSLFISSLDFNVTISGVYPFLLRCLVLVLKLVPDYCSLTLQLRSTVLQRSLQFLVSLNCNNI
jgi:hypothetical protein